MSLDQILAFCAFAAISSITPGPNNMMLLASGLNHGFVRSLPHLAGISIGFVILVFATGLGMHALFVQVPALQTVLKYVGAAYLLWLAWKLARAVPVAPGEASATKPMSFFGAAAFQWVNPKAWVMAISALTTYLPHAFGVPDVLLLALVFGAVGAPCIAAWASCGVAMRRVLQNPRSVRIFNGVCAALLVASLYPILFE
ncbi:LysE family translocator [Rhizobacter sp. Root1221]|uniref:LysE family translocator n=1 Tax=Rhizobacter sp. Root1221 TaxID=1736433 RepID=UPI0006FE82CF|nr:LysE family translocator [Rhizobacter sp. Root1221]KQV82942.1 lysine transporter LysE [Rhizobacter sp. Root1221]